MIVHDISKRIGENRRTSDEKPESADRKKAKFGTFKDIAESVKTTAKVLAVAVGATVMVSGCGSGSKYRPEDGDSDVQEETIDADTEIDAPDIPDSMEDMTGDTFEESDVPEDTIMDTSADETEEEPEPTCFEIPPPIHSDVDPVLRDSDSQLAAFESDTGSEEINANVVANVSMTGYPVHLGTCPFDPDSEVFVGAPSSYSFESDISMEVGGAVWDATVADMPGTPCGPLTDDSLTLVSRNDVTQEVPKNATMAGIPTSAEFDLMAVSASLISYEKNGTIEASGTMDVSGVDFAPVSTIKTILNPGEWDIEVESRAGDSSDYHTYSATLSGKSSKTARIYPKTPEDSQIYEVSWDESRQFWCSRCREYRDFELVIPGDLLCKITDSCGCVGDGFTVNVTSVSLDKTGVPAHLLGIHVETSPPSRTGTGVSALSDPATDHPEVSISFTRGTVSWDGGEVVDFWVNIALELESEHLNPEGGHDVVPVTLRVQVTDPWAWGSLEPTYETYCVPCTYDY